MQSSFTVPSPKEGAHGDGVDWSGGDVKGIPRGIGRDLEGELQVSGQFYDAHKDTKQRTRARVYVQFSERLCYLWAPSVHLFFGNRCDNREG